MNANLSVARTILRAALLLLVWFSLTSLVHCDDDDLDDETGIFTGKTGVRGPDKCAMPFLSNGRVKIRSRGRVAKFICRPFFQTLGKRFATCIRGRWSFPPPLCISQGCSPLTAPRNGRMSMEMKGAIAKFYCNPGYTLNGSPSLYCDSVWWNSTVIPTCRSTGIQAQLQVSCDFELDLCDWIQDTSDDFDWKRFNLATPSGDIGTGPSFDHTKGVGQQGHYMYIEASSPRKEKDVARLYSPVYNGAVYRKGCFRFWYHMYGTNTGELRIRAIYESIPLNMLLPNFVKSNDQGNIWHSGILRIADTLSDFQIIIEAVRGSGYAGDSAIDDVTLLTEEECQPLLLSQSEVSTEDRLNSFSASQDPTELTSSQTVTSLPPVSTATALSSLSPPVELESSSAAIDANVDDSRTLSSLVQSFETTASPAAIATTSIQPVAPQGVTTSSISLSGSALLISTSASSVVDSPQPSQTESLDSTYVTMSSQSFTSRLDAGAQVTPTPTPVMSLPVGTYPLQSAVPNLTVVPTLKTSTSSPALASVTTIPSTSTTYHVDIPITPTRIRPPTIVTAIDMPRRLGQNTTTTTPGTILTSPQRLPLTTISFVQNLTTPSSTRPTPKSTTLTRTTTPTTVTDKLKSTVATMAALVPIRVTSIRLILKPNTTSVPAITRPIKPATTTTTKTTTITTTTTSKTTRPSTITTTTSKRTVTSPTTVIRKPSTARIRPAAPTTTSTAVIKRTTRLATVTPRSSTVTTKSPPTITRFSPITTKKSTSTKSPVTTAVATTKKISYTTRTTPNLTTKTNFITASTSSSKSSSTTRVTPTADVTELPNHIDKFEVPSPAITAKPRAVLPPWTYLRTTTGPPGSSDSQSNQLNPFESQARTTAPGVSVPTIIGVAAVALVSLVVVAVVVKGVYKRRRLRQHRLNEDSDVRYLKDEEVEFSDGLIRYDDL